MSWGLYSLYRPLPHTLWSVFSCCLSNLRDKQQKPLFSRSRGKASRQEPLHASHLAEHTCCPEWELGMHLGFFHMVNAREDCSNERCRSPISISLQTTAAQRALALTPGVPTLAKHWAPPGPKPAQRAGNVTTLMTRQDIYRFGMWTHSHQEVSLLNTAERLQRTSYGS